MQFLLQFGNFAISPAIWKWESEPWSLICGVLDSKSDGFQLFLLQQGQEIPKQNGELECGEVKGEEIIKKA